MIPCSNCGAPVPVDAAGSPACMITIATEAAPLPPGAYPLCGNPGCAYTLAVRHLSEALTDPEALTRWLMGRVG